MLTLEQGKLAIKLARKAIESIFKRRNIEFTEEEEKELNDKEFKEKRGVFVTLHTYPRKELRGCIGLPYPTLPLKKAIIEAAKSAAFNDPRFFQLTEKELNNIVIEISVLTIPKQIKAKPEILPKKIKIGEDGLICSSGNNQGLLLPQVATEEKWGSKEFLQHTCIKTGLPAESWLNKDCNFYKFQAQIFIEEKPNGDVMKK